MVVVRNFYLQFFFFFFISFSFQTKFPFPFCFFNWNITPYIHNTNNNYRNLKISLLSPPQQQHRRQIQQQQQIVMKLFYLEIGILKDFLQILIEILKRNQRVEVLKELYQIQKINRMH